MLPNPLEEIARKLDEYNKRLSHLERLEAGGAWTLIETIELGIAAASIDFQNIPATFQHLKLLGSIRTDLAANGLQVSVRLNNDSGNNYDSLFGQIVHSASVATSQIIGGNRMEPIVAPGASAPANSFASMELALPDYVDTNKHKTLHQIGGAVEDTTSGNIKFRFGMGRWRDTSVVNRVTFFFSTGDNFEQHSLISLYGIRG